MTDGRDVLEGKAKLNAAAGGISSGAVFAALFPMDVLKTHVQTAEFDRRTLASRLYRGFAPAIVEHSLNRYMLFGMSTLIRSQLPCDWPQPMRDASSGFGAAFVKTIFLHPLDTIKCRWQLGQPRCEMHGLYNGFSAAVTRSATGMAIWLAVRNHLERVLPDENTPVTGAWGICPSNITSLLFSSTMRHFLSGALASMITDLATFPLDTLKKNLQAAPTGKGSNLIGVGSMTLQLLSNGGILRFYHGYGVRLTMVGMKGAMDNLIFVYCKRLLEPYF